MIFVQMHMVVCFEVLESSTIRIWYFKEIFLFLSRWHENTLRRECLQAQAHETDGKETSYIKKIGKSSIFTIFDMATLWLENLQDLKWQDT